jgi:hypothetical protein
MFMFSTANNYSLDRATLSKLVNHRHAAIVIPILLLTLVTIVAIVAGVVSHTGHMDKTTSSGIPWSEEAIAGGVSEEFKWSLHDFRKTVYGSADDHDRVYLRLEGSSVQWIIIKTSNGREKKNNTLALTVLEVDMLSILLSNRYTANGTYLPNQTIYNGRRKVMMQRLNEEFGEEEERVRFTLVKHIPKNNTWVCRNSVVLPNAEIHTLMGIYNTKIRDKLSRYEDRAETPMVGGYDDLAEPSDDDDDDDEGPYTVTRPKLRKLENPPVESMDSSEPPKPTTNTTEEH